jgi:xylulose-5-phosphate/fructose-6-phosphate phosphoketolase
MPGQEISSPNPPPDSSLLSEDILKLKIELDIQNALTSEELKAVKAFRRAADYIAAGMFSMPFVCVS